MIFLVDVLLCVVYCVVCIARPHPVLVLESPAVELLTTEMESRSALCRLCASSSPNTTNAFSPRGLELCLPEKMAKCLPVQVSLFPVAVRRSGQTRWRCCASTLYRVYSSSCQL